MRIKLNPCSIVEAQTYKSTGTVVYAMPHHLRWTKEPPTEPGWYFNQRVCHNAENQYPLRVVHIHYDEYMGERMLCYSGCAWYGVEDERQSSSPLCGISKRVMDEMLWAGPIQEPVE